MAEARTKKLSNPFYIALLFVGAVFGLTACAYVVMMVKLATPQPFDADSQSGFVFVLNRYGTLILVVELAMLGVLTLAAIATDDYWTGDSSVESRPSSKSATKGVEGSREIPKK
jgi:hypothetical protein